MRLFRMAEQIKNILAYFMLLLTCTNFVQKNSIVMKSLLLSCLLFCLIKPSVAQSYIYTPVETDLANSMERIIDFHANIEVKSDGNLIVTEYITIYAGGIDIRHGIVRSIPQNRADTAGLKRQTPLKVVSLTNNGDTSGYHTKVSGNEILIYAGTSDIILEKGIYQYKLVYETQGKIGHGMRGQVLFFDDFAELTWNVMGGDCAYTTERVSATLHLPNNAEAIRWSCYTGITGSTEQDCDCDNNKAAFTFRTSRALQPNEGFTISVAFPQNIVLPPTAAEKSIEQSWNWAIAITHLFVILTFMGLSWLIAGRGARRPVVIPQFSPPNGWSAEQVSYLNKCKFNARTFTAALLQMAVRGAIGIECRQNHNDIKEYYITNKAVSFKDLNLNNNQQDIYEKLNSAISSSKRKSLKLSPLSKDILGSAAKNLKDAITRIIPTDNLYKIKYGYTKAALYINIAFFISYLLMYNHYNGDYISLFITPVILIIIQMRFVVLMKAPTAFGAKVKSDLAGLKMYLVTAEKHRLNYLTPPEQTPEHFEEMLPYAFALGVENKWCEKFHDVLKKYNYSPNWFDTDSDIDKLSNITSKHFIREVNHSVRISSKYKEPSSFYSSSSSSGSSSRSSGSSGGGYSGSGGGGGGVRGW